MPQYDMYLDESETFTASGQKYFAIGGIIIPTADGPAISQDLDALKLTLWDQAPGSQQNILHETEISAAHRTRPTSNPCYSIFRSNGKYRQLYQGLSRILTQYHITTMAVCLDLSKLEQLYGTDINPKITIALQLLLENYCHFLLHSNAVGNICYESLQEPGNQPLRQRFHELEALGSLYYSPRLLQTHIGNIRFCSKTDNLPGLQLADFIPNTVARVAAHLPPKHTAFKDTVLRRLYDGYSRDRNRFGLKIVP